MSYWLPGKNSEGKETITSSSALAYEGGRSWLSCIILAALYSSVVGLILCILLPYILPNLGQSKILLALLVIFVPFAFFVWLFRPKRKNA
jgi:hypothetical protein